MNDAASDIRFSFEFLDSNKDCIQGLQEWDVRLLVEIEGYFCIQLDGKTIFEEECFNVLEFGADLLSWLKAINVGVVEDHDYLCVEYGDGPLISFRRVTEDTWEILSPWLEVNSPPVVDGVQLFRACTEYVNTLRSRLLASYGIRLENVRLY